MARMKFICDAERCIECNGCVTACKNEHEVPWGINRRRVVTLNDGAKGERRDDQPDRVHHACHAATAQDDVNRLVARRHGITICQCRPCAFEKGQRRWQFRITCKGDDPRRVLDHSEKSAGQGTGKDRDEG